MFSNQSYTKREIEGQTGGILTWLGLAWLSIKYVRSFISSKEILRFDLFTAVKIFVYFYFDSYF